MEVVVERALGYCPLSNVATAHDTRGLGLGVPASSLDILLLAPWDYVNLWMAAGCDGDIRDGPETSIGCHPAQAHKRGLLAVAASLYGRLSRALGITKASFDLVSVRSGPQLK